MEKRVKISQEKTEYENIHIIKLSIIIFNLKYYWRSLDHFIFNCLIGNVYVTANLRKYSKNKQNYTYTANL